jgi:ATP-dependent DNA helicase RecQ
MLQRDKPFRELEIDFETLEKRKAEEYEKLERVIEFARTRRCRQLEILRYFGQKDAQACHNCDNCGGETGGGGKNCVTQTPEGAVLEAVRIVLSGVARAHGRFGKQVIAQMLCGATTAKVTKFRLDRLSTYGLLSHLKQQEVTLLIDALINAGCLEQTDVERFRPIVQLTDLGAGVMRGQTTLTGGLTLPVPLFRKLGGSARATSKKKAPKSEAARETPVEHPPLEPASAPHGDAAPLSDPRMQQYVEATAQPAHYWTWRLLASGFTPAECAVIRGLEPGIVLDHALRALEAGMAVQAGWFLSPEMLSRMEEVIGDTEPQRIRPLLAQLPRGTRYEEVLLYLKCREGP